MDSSVGLLIQSSGIFLIAILSFFLTRSLRSQSLRYWCAGWFCLALALCSLIFAFKFAEISKPFLAFYFFGEYAFSLLLIAGCRHFASGVALRPRDSLLLIPALLFAAALAIFGDDYVSAFNLHALALGTTFVAAFFALKPAPRALSSNFGLSVMRIALALLAFDFYHYALAFTFRETFYSFLFRAGFYSFNSIADLVIEILLGFGMVIVLLERVTHEVEEVNAKLQTAHAKLEQLAHVDQLTSAFNRHAFHNLLQNRTDQQIFGCAGVFDIDNLKPINDRFGHAAGDDAIRAVATAIRSLIRADDLLFRWGGDEFFVVMFGITETQARARMNQLPKLLEKVSFVSSSQTQTVFVSFGFAVFSESADLETAINLADAEMYRAKQKSKQMRGIALA